MESAAAVGMIRRNCQPAATNKSRNCFSVRSHPPGNQHLEIEELAGREIIAGLNDAVDDEKSAERIHAFSAAFEELDA